PLFDHPARLAPERARARRPQGGPTALAAKPRPSPFGDGVAPASPQTDCPVALLARQSGDKRAMPELPDVTVYVEALAARIAGQRLEGVRVASPFLLRSVDPPLSTAAGRLVASVRRLGKRVVIDLEGDLHLVLHLMIAGRLHWKPGPAPEGRRAGRT